LKYTVMVKFSIGDDLRFLSHQETVSMFHRALVRSGTSLVYSEGFNPRPRFSLPFPRSVGVAAYGDMLCFAVECEPEQFDCRAFQNRLAAELPEGVVLESVDAAAGSAVCYPLSADHVFRLKKGLMDEKVKEKAGVLGGQGDCLVERHQPKKGTTRMVNARDFVESVSVDGDEVAVRCRITQSGAIRVDELMKLLGIEQPMLAGAVTRRNVHWQRSN
jgi:radical SAM-linked protein